MAIKNYQEKRKSAQVSPRKSLDAEKGYFLEKAHEDTSSNAYMTRNDQYRTI